jgi:Domain of unknown function (DUF5668)/B-box zinc finger
MNCANHPDIAAVAFCRTCGKPLCGTCTRDVRGVVYCEPCLAARLDGTVPAAGFVAPPAVYPPVGTIPRPVSGSGPNPAVAGILAGFFPFGVGAVYCSQYAKGLAHLLIFVMLIFASDHAGNWDWIFGLGIAFFYVYQIIDAVRTARALQEGQPAPDPMGLGQTFSMGEKFDAGKVPVGAIVLIGLGLLFLLHTMRIFETGLDRLWPLILVFLGAWMFYRNYERARQSCGCGRCMARCMMGPALVLTTGILFFLDSMDIAELHRTWPAWILVVGVVKLLQSSASSVGHVGPLPPSPPGVGAGTGVAPPPPPAFSNQAPPDPASSNQASSNQASSSSGEVHNG